MEMALKEMQKSWEEKLREAEEKAKKAARVEGPSIDLSQPHLANLNEDPQGRQPIKYSWSLQQFFVNGENMLSFDENI